MTASRRKGRGIIGTASAGVGTRAVAKTDVAKRLFAKRGSVRIGTSGWAYDGWRGLFYPGDLPKNAWLRYYATQFSTTEINGSFYRTPESGSGAQVA